MNKNHLKIKRMVGIASLSGLVIVLQLIAGYLPKLPGGLSLSLTLVPIIIGSILYGVKGGAFLGLVMSIMVLLDPSTSVFYGANLFGTFLTVLIKSPLAGAVSGIMFKWLYKHNFFLAIVVSSIICPIINTGVFSLFSLIFFREVFGGGLFVILAAVVGNFIVELCVNAVLCPTISTIIKLAFSKYNIGTNLDKDYIINNKKEEK